MNNQRALFQDLEEEAPLREPHGFRYQEQFISEDEEIALVASLQQLNLKPFEFHGYLGNRRVANFGWKYDFTQRLVKKADGPPPFLDDLLGRAARFAGYTKDFIQQVGINEYREGAGIGWHKDKPEFGIIVGVSLLAPAIMRFRKAQGNGWTRVSHELRPRSVYLLAGESRTEWEHSIPALAALRYSITMRTLAGGSPGNARLEEPFQDEL